VCNTLADARAGTILAPILGEHAVLDGKEDEMATFFLIAGIVVVVWLVLIAALQAVQRSRENSEYLNQVQRRIDRIANTN
jgi:hypothetical protein